MTIQAIAAALLLSLCGTALAQEGEEAPAATTAAETETAPTIDLPLPWKEGRVLRYEFEQLESAASAKGREKSRATSITELHTKRAGKDGYEVHWISYDVAHKTLEGDAGMDALIQPAMKKMEREPMVILLDADGAFKAVANVEHLSRRLREVLEPLMDEAMAAGIKAAARDAKDEGVEEEAMRQAKTMLQSFLDAFTSPKVVEGVASKQARNMAFFNAGGLEDGASYELDTELENPTGGANFPTRMTFGLWVSEDDPEDVYIEWTSTIDPVKGASVLADTVSRLVGSEVKLDAKDLPQQVSIVDSGFMLVHRPTGMVEMYEDERNTVLGDRKKHERTRMRLLDAGHGHEWKQAAP